MAAICDQILASKERRAQDITEPHSDLRIVARLLKEQNLQIDTAVFDCDVLAKRALCPIANIGISKSPLDPGQTLERQKISAIWVNKRRPEVQFAVVLETGVRHLQQPCCAEIVYGRLEATLRLVSPRRAREPDKQRTQ